MARRMVAQGNITIMDFSDAIISSYPPDNPFENMLWIDTSQNPPIQKIYRYIYDDDGNIIGEGWVDLTETLPIPPSIDYGGYLTCLITTSNSLLGKIKISTGYFSSNKVAKKVIANECEITTMLNLSKGRQRFIIFTNGDTDVNYECSSGTNNNFIIAKYESHRWYYEHNGELVRFIPKDYYCNVGKIVEYSPGEGSVGIKEIVMYSENAQTMFDFLTNEGEKQGLFKTEDGKVFINGEYVNARNLKVVDATGTTTLYINEQGEVTINATNLEISGKAVEDKIAESVDNIEIGGRNLLRKSKTFGLDSTRVNGWVNSGNKWTVAYSEEDQCYIASTSSSGLTAIGIKSFFSNKISCIQGDIFTLSCWIRITDITAFDYGVTFILEEFDDDGNRVAYQDTDPAKTTGTNKITFASGEWTYCTATYTIKNSATTKFGIRLALFKNGEIFFKLPKLEKGNKATDWTPAPEDVEGEISSKLDDDSEKVFKTLTNNGTRQGLYLKDGNFYFNGQYINAKNLKVIDNNGNTTLYINENGEVTINATNLEISGKAVEDKIAESIDDIQIGGRNLVKVSNGIITFTNTSHATKKIRFIINTIDLQQLIGQDITYSYFLHCPGEGTDITGSYGNRFGSFGEVIWGNDAGETTTVTLFSSIQSPSNITNTRVFATETLTPPTGYTKINNLYIYIMACRYPSAEGVTWQIGQPKLEIGNKPTDYTQAPEDTQTLLDKKVGNTPDEVFKALTNNGTKQGIYMGTDGNFYINGQYINSKNLQATNTDGDTTFRVDENGNVYILATDLKIAGADKDKTIGDIITEQTATNLKSVYVYYYLSTSQTELSGGSWSLTAPEWENGKYMWQKTVVALSNGSTNESAPTCIAGAIGSTGEKGVSVTKISKRYGTSTNVNTKPTTWYTSFPTWDANNQPYIWTKSIITYSDSHTTETEPYVDTCWQQVMEKADSKVDNNQTAVFNTLTNNGTEQGIYIQNGKIYINGTYIKAGTIDGQYIKANTLNASKITFDDLSGKDIKGARFFTAPDSTQTDGYAFRIYSTGEVYSAKRIQVYGTASDGLFSELNPDSIKCRNTDESKATTITPGIVKANQYLQAPGLKTQNQNLYFAINNAAIPGTGDNAARLRFCEIDGNKFFMPDYNATSSTVGVRLGSSGHMWSTVYAKGGVSSSSDRTLKENIRYLDADNPNATLSTDYTEDDLYNFVRDDLMMAEYNFIGDDEKFIGFIAQDLLYNADGSDNVIGQIIVNKPGEEQAPLSYNEKNYMGILAGALRKAIKKIEDLEKRVEELEKK